MRRLVGLVPKPVISCRVAAEAGAAGRRTPTPIAAAAATPARKVRQSFLIVRSFVIEVWPRGCWWHAPRPHRSSGGAGRRRGRADAGALETELGARTGRHSAVVTDVGETHR